MNEKIIPFAYSDLPAPVVAEIEAVTARIKDRLTRQVADIIETGRDLIEVKYKLEHGKFAGWLDNEFGMAVRTAQRFMRASEWAQDKNDIVSYLTPTTIYMISAKSAPEGVHEKVVERLEKGLYAEPGYIRHVIQEAKIREREAKNRKGKRETPAERKRREARWERERCKEEEERQDAGQVIIGGPSYDRLCRAWNACSEAEGSGGASWDEIGISDRSPSVAPRACRNQPRPIRGAPSRRRA